MQSIPYSFLSGTFNQQNKVTKYINEWTKYAGVTFVVAGSNGQTASPLIRISFDASTGNWSALGSLAQSVPSGQATMNLGWIFDTTDEQPYEKGVILHMFGHALGLTHEYTMEDGRLDHGGELVRYLQRSEFN